MLSGAERGEGGARLTRHLLNAADNERVEVLPGRNLTAVGLAAQLREIKVNGGGCRTPRTFYHVHLDPDPSWSEEDRRRGEALWWAKFEAEFPPLATAAYSEVRHTKHGRGHTHRVYDLAGGARRLADMSFDRYRRQRLSAEVAFELGRDCPPIAHPDKIIKELEKRGRRDIADHVRNTWRRLDGPEHEDLTPPAGTAAASAPRRRSPRRDGISPEAAPIMVAPITPRGRMQRDRTGVDPAAVAATALAAIRLGDSGPARTAALRDAGLPLHMGDKVPVVLDATGNAHPLLRALNAALKSTGEAPLRKRDLDGLLAGAEIAPLPAAGARPKPARRPAPASQPAAAPPDVAADLVFPTLADLDAIDAIPVPTVAPAPAEVPARASAPPANADAYRGAETFEGAWQIAFGPTPTVTRPAAPQRPSAIRAPGEGRRSRAPVAVPPPPRAQRLAPAPFVAAIGADLDAPGWEAESWWTAVIEHVRAWLRGEVSEPVSPPQPATPEPPVAHLDRAAPLVAFGKYRDNAQRGIAEKLLTRIFEHAGVADAAAAGALLVALREGALVRHWNPATLARGGSPVAVAQQRRDLADRAAQLAALEVRINAAPPPTVPPIDALWLAHCRRHHGTLLARTEADLAKARRALDDARQSGDRREIRRWDSALSILANERHRLLCRLRAERGGQDWNAVWRDAAQAGGLLRELRERQLRAVRDERTRIAAAIRASDTPTNSGVGTRPGYTKGSGGSIRRGGRPAPPSDEATPPRPKG